MRNISSWSISNPVAPLVAFFMLTLAGVISFITMDINDNPDVSFPVASVVVSQPGAAPSELETQVTQRVEAALQQRVVERAARCAPRGADVDQHVLIGGGGLAQLARQHDVERHLRRRR